MASSDAMFGWGGVDGFPFESCTFKPWGRVGARCGAPMVQSYASPMSVVYMVVTLRPDDGLSSVT